MCSIELSTKKNHSTYVTFREGEVDVSAPLSEDICLADYDSDGNLIGIEILVPVKIKISDNAAER